MPLLEDFLLRFRRVWASPGPVAGLAAVPADLEAGVDEELRELTSSLDAIDEEGRSIVQAAEDAAASIVALAQSEADRTIEVARATLPEVRTTKAAASIRDRRTDRDQLIATAEKQAIDLRLRALARMQSVAGRVVSDVFEDIAGSVEEEHARVVGGG